jgi:hypothetical protein
VFVQRDDQVRASAHRFRVTLLRSQLRKLTRSTLDSDALLQGFSPRLRTSTLEPAWIVLDVNDLLISLGLFNHLSIGSVQLGVEVLTEREVRCIIHRQAIPVRRPGGELAQLAQDGVERDL